ncbi:cation efflux protein [Durotheca rogersii]|uniref:cation efflux protein n=1 Tax=Durotheca rogersii TaxID=419775 RepID=UPI00221FBF9F|nr:cation efflux protein [Durotheca rogersii]KAI5859659.1 cation efflux protein [Durotheca rogersii]
MGWSKTTRISVMLAIDIAFFLLELITGIMVHSLALTADAFHMLNDIISLVIGLWAVTIAKRANTNKFSYGWVRAEILGAFFNAVFLIALCVTIILDAMTRFIEPAEISQPVLILVVGCCGLASNLVGFLVLGGHGHDHGHGHDEEHDHDHKHDDVSAAEEGRLDARQQFVDEDGPAMDVLPEVALARVSAANAAPETTRRIQFNRSEESHERCASRGSPRGRERRRASSLKHSHLASLDNLSIHPSTFRQDIIDQSRSNGSENETDESSNDESSINSVALDEPAVDEATPLIADERGMGRGAVGQDKHTHRPISQPYRARRNSATHVEHHHNQPKSKSKKGHGHSHGDMGMNAMILHVLGDALGNVGVIVTALIIWLTEWRYRYYADPAVSLFITLIILKSAVPLTMATAKVLLQATPDHINLQHIKEDIQALPGVISCHHVHIWQLSDTKVVASLHIQVAFPIQDQDGEKYMTLAKQARKCLHAYGIHSATIQPEFCLDQDCSHGDDGSLTLEGQASPRYGGDLCLLECVDDCVGQGCCTLSVRPASGAGSSRRSSHSTHSHGDNHDHDHDHGDDHSHSHSHSH